MSDEPITVLVADDQQLVRSGFSVMLDGEPGISVVGEAGNGQQAVVMARELRPSIVLMDIRMPIMDGLQASREIIASTSARILVLTTFDADEYVYEALRFGASGFLLKDSPPEQLIGAVRVIARGDALIDPAITRRLITAFARSNTAPVTSTPTFSMLTPRELQVLRQIARGLSNREIARALVVEESTIRTHVTHILMKLGLRDRVQAVVLAYESGLVTPTGE
ncbi:response regulator transcription factor [Lapillicoccus sp.]|uniref:response regulator transcription factor n=1 Tax=Lapillicoccus sp. TaxID=1909287 RepID=UPI00326530F4